MSVTAAPVTPTTLVRYAGLAAAAAGLLFIAVQIGHPVVDLGLVTTTQWSVRQSVKIVMAVLSLVGITGIYACQVRRMRIIGLLGYLLFAAGYLVMFATEVIGLVVVPSIAGTSPGYVSDVLAAATSGPVHGDIGLMSVLAALGGAGFIGGGLVFGIGVVRAGVLARWAGWLLIAGTVATATIPLLPQVNQRLFAIPPSIALIGLGWSVWRTVGGTSVRAEPALGMDAGAWIRPRESVIDS